MRFGNLAPTPSSQRKQGPVATHAFITRLLMEMTISSSIWRQEAAKNLTQKITVEKRLWERQSESANTGPSRRSSNSAQIWKRRRNQITRITTLNKSWKRKKRWTPLKKDEATWVREILCPSDYNSRRVGVVIVVHTFKDGLIFDCPDQFAS